MTTPEFVLRASQTGLWLAQSLAGATKNYSVAEYVDIAGPLDVERFASCVRETITTTDTLRVRFRDTPSGPRQFVIPADGRLPQLVDVSGEDDPVGAALQWMRTDAARRVDLTGDELVNGAVLVIGRQRNFYYQRAHHVVLDGLSGRRVVQQAVRRYVGASDKAPQAPGVADLAAIEESYRGSGAFADDRRHWQEVLGQWSAPPDLSHQSFQRDDVQLRVGGPLDPGLVDALVGALPSARAWSGAAIAASTVLAARLTERTEVLVGLPVTGRSGPVERAAMSMMSNVVPVAVRIDRRTTLSSLVQDVGAQVRQAFRHQHYRYEDMRRHLGLTCGERMFALELNLMPFVDDLGIPGCTTRFHNIANPPGEDLSLTLYGSPDSRRLDLDVDGAAQRFQEEDLERIRGAYARLLDRLVHDPQAPVLDLDLVDSDDRAYLARVAHGPPRSRPVDSVPATVSRHAADSPDAVAVTHSGSDLSYAELDAHVADLARRLTSAGVQEGSAVVSVLPRSVEAVVALLAVLRAGGTYVPVDPAHPAAHTSRVISAVNPTVALVAERFGAPDVGVPVMALNLAAPPPGLPPEAPAAPRPADPLSLAYTIFTSGSTGQPKGAMVETGGLLNHLWSKVEDLDLASSSRIMFNAPITFDVSIWQMLAPLLVGGQVQVVDATAGNDALLLFEELARAGSTVVEVVPSQVRAVLDAWADGITPVDLPELRTFVVNGEVLISELVRRWYARFPHTRLVNAYGLTECSDDTTHAHTSLPVPQERLPVGRVLPNQHVHILDSRLQLAPPGVTGDLYIGGDGVGRGYVGQPALTAERYVADPFASRPGARMYRTGDRARWRSDGQLDFLGRSDHQVKIRGNRVELEAVTATLRSLPGVRDAVVVVDHVPSTARLVAYVVAETTPEDLRPALRGLLPDYMVPSLLIPLEELPLNTNGKVDRSGLPEPAAFVAPDPSSAVGFDDGATEAMAGVFADVLGSAGVRADDDFFELGGDSVTAIGVVSGAFRAGLSLTVADVFQHRTPRLLAASAGELDDSSQAPWHGSVPLTPLMSQIRQAPGRVTGFHQVVTLTVPAGLRHEHLVTSVEVLRATHPMLTSRITAETDPWDLQVPAEPLVSAASCVQALTVDPGDIDARAREGTAAAVGALDPLSGRMMHVIHLDAGPQSPGRVVFAASHLAVDGWSWQILVPQLVSAYERAAGGRDAAPVPERMRFVDWQPELERRGDHWREQVDYWSTVCREPSLSLGTSALQPADTHAESETMRVVLPAEVTETLDGELGDCLNISLETTLAITLARACGTVCSPRGGGRASDLVIDVESHGRALTGRPGDPAHSPDPSGTVGFFTSVHPVRLTPGDGELCGPELWTSMKRMKEQFVSTPDAGLGYGLLLDDPTVSLSSSPADICFNYLGRLGIRDRADGWMLDGDHPPTGGGDPSMPLLHAIEIDAMQLESETGPRLIIDLRWAPRACAGSTVSDLAKRWVTTLEDLVSLVRDDPALAGLTPSDMPLISIDQAEIDDLEAELSASVTRTVDR